jgi:hypothetical protein
MTIFATDLPSDDDFGLAFYDGLMPIADRRHVNVISPLPVEIGPRFRSIVPKKVTVFLGTDPLNRTAGLVSTIAGSGITTDGITLPLPVDFWSGLMSADTAVCSPGIPALTATALGIPTQIVANTAQEDANMQSIITHGPQGWDYRGMLSGLTNANVRDTVRGLVNGTGVGAAPDPVSRQLALSALGAGSRRKTGVRRIAEWIVRSLVGTNRKLVPLYSFPAWPNHEYAFPDPGDF